MKIIYIAGPITGMKNLNREAFDNASKELKSLGYIVRNPHEFCSNIPKDAPWEMFMRICISVLSECTDVILLNGWKHSTGANLEKHIATELSMNIHYGVEDFKSNILADLHSEEQGVF
ncbi:DUF4406 domain-containing protein [Sphingobacterium spiritivorum]|uniref:DUF4406 domain-containing protein n=1 Tax=Sphingobacterium spiritivorum TaxID=258 RepID=UPI003DA57795